MNNCHVQGVPDLPPSVTPRVCQKKPRFSMCPDEVTLDSSLSSEAVRIYLILTRHNYKNGKKTNMVQLSLRDLAQYRGYSRETARRYVNELIAHGHIEKLGKARGRSCFRLLSPVFDYMTYVQTGPKAETAVASKALPILRDKKRVCPKCQRIARITSTSGACDECLAEWMKRLA